MIDKETGLFRKYSAEDRIFHDFPISTCHWHNYYEAEFVVGCGVTEYINGQEVRMPTNSLVLLSPKDFHSILPEDRNRVRFMTFSIRESEMTGVLHELFSKYPVPYVLKFGDEDAAKYLSLFQELREAIADETTAPDKDIARMLVRNAIEHIVLFIAKCGIASGEISRDNPIMASDDERIRSLHMMLSYIDEHLAQGIRRDELAEYMHFSPNYLSLFFRKALGVAMSQYISELRLSRAADLLEDTDDPANVIMDLVGYRSRSLFYRDFTEKYGMAPGEYREAVAGRRNMRLYKD